jgi:hypothetical protein
MKKPRQPRFTGKPYTPREGSLAAHLVATLRDPAEPERLTSSDIARRFGTTSSAVANCLKPAVLHGLLRETRDGGRIAYELGPAGGAVTRPPGKAAPPEEPATPAPWAAALWTDGELALHGLTLNTEGVAVLSADQTRELAQLLKGVAL